MMKDMIRQCLFWALMVMSIWKVDGEPVELELKKGMLTASIEVFDLMIGVNVTYTGSKERYVAFGWSESSTNIMFNSECVIGTDGVGPPAKYKLRSSALSGSGVIRRPSSEQTLINATWTVDSVKGETTVSFFKLLKEDGEIEIKIDEPMIFIYSLGEDYGLTYHYTMGIKSATLSSGVSETIQIKHEKEYQAHGILAFIAWGVLVPMAVAASLLRDFLPKGPLWLKLHGIFNNASVLFTIVSFSLAVSLHQKENKKHFSSPISNHQAVGLFLFIAATCQALSGVFRPSLPHSPTTPENQDKDGKEKTNQAADDDNDDVEDNVKPEEHTAALAEEKSTQRKIWEVLHKLCGYFFVAYAAWEIHEGIRLYGMKYSVNVDNLQKAFIAWIVGLAGIVAIAKAYLVMVLPNKE